MAKKSDFIRLNNAEYDESVDTILARMEHEVAHAKEGEEVVFDMLAIHGGGAAGGFAAGVLTAWGEIEDPYFRRPHFDHVSGASSGALVAPFAFVGTDDAYAQVYRTALNPPFNFKIPGPFSLWPTRGGMLSNHDLHQALDSFFDEAMVGSLAIGAGEMRSLLIGVTDLEAGLVRAWDIALEARDLPLEASMEKLPKIILASAAVPVLLPPVEIDGHLYGDGGIGATVFLGMDAYGIELVAERFKKRNPTTPIPTIRIWVIINSKLLIDPEDVKPRYPDIAMRSLNVMMAYDRQKALMVMALLAEEMNTIDGVSAEFRWIAIPECAKTPDSITEMQDEELIQSLVGLGLELGSDPKNWNLGAPNITRLSEPEDDLPVHGPIEVSN